MKLTPGILLNAISEFSRLPNKKKILTDEQQQWFSDPENVFLMLFVALTTPNELEPKLKENIPFWIEAAIAELKQTVANFPPQAKVHIEEVIEQMLMHTHNQTMINPEWESFVIATLKKNHFHINKDLSDLNSVSPISQMTERPELKMLLEQTSTNSAIEFITLFEGSLSRLPIEALGQILNELTPYPWAIDALLLLTQSDDQSIALTCAQALNQYDPKKWAQLSNQQILNLCVRFNRHPSIKQFFKQWQKNAMRYSSANPVSKINELYLTHIDGNDCASLMMSITINGQENQISSLFDSKTGIRESLINSDPEISLQDTIKQLSEQVETGPVAVEFIKTSPNCLAITLPWILSIQQQNGAFLDLYSFYWLSQLPFAWTQPASFDLNNWGQKLDYQANEDRLEISRRSHTIGNPLMMTWLAPYESVQAAKKAKDLLKLYYYPNKDIFAARLAYSAAIKQHQLIEYQTYPTSCAEYLDLAHALYDPNINRKRFELFESLAEISIEEVIASQDESQQVASEQQGLVVKISLQHASPAVWRRVHLSNQLTLSEMHQLIQVVMGWEDDHLFAFLAKHRSLPEKFYQKIKLANFLKTPGDEIEYHYDFGDDWQHVIRLEKTLKRDIDTAKVTAGNGICPAEDSGGIWQWNHMLKMRKKKNLNEEELEHLEWVGLSPDESLAPFNKEEINQHLNGYF